MKYLKWMMALLIGATAGFAYWYFIGCTTGSCAITSSPVNSSLYGALMGGLMLNMFRKDNKSAADNK